MTMTATLSLDTYRLLGRSGLRVSPMALGTMTFGTDWGWGADEAEARRIFDAYVDSGGNFIDNANRYTDGTSDQCISAIDANRHAPRVISTTSLLPSRTRNSVAAGQSVALPSST